jgi:hypothetical protein
MRLFGRSGIAAAGGGAGRLDARLHGGWGREGRGCRTSRSCTAARSEMRTASGAGGGRRVKASSASSLCGGHDRKEERAALILRSVVRTQGFLRKGIWQGD